MALLERVKTTYNTEKKMVERLHKVNAESPVKFTPPHFENNMLKPLKGVDRMNKTSYGF